MLQRHRFILPVCDNDGRDVTAVHMNVERMLSRTFGGLTRTPCSGVWYDDDGTRYSDESVAYDVALDPANADGFIHIATDAAKRAGQLAVYVETPDGAQIIDIDHGNERKAA